MFKNTINNDTLTFIREIGYGEKRKEYKYVCLKCQNHGTFTTIKQKPLFKTFIINNDKDNSIPLTKGFIACPKCKNNNVIEQEQVFYKNTYFNETEDNYIITSYGNSYLLVAPYKLITNDNHLLTLKQRDRLLVEALALFLAVNKLKVNTTDLNNVKNHMLEFVELVDAQLSN